MRFFTLTILLSATVWATPFHKGHGKGPWWPKHAAKAAYFLDDDPAGSSIVSLRLDESGMLSDPIRTSTNGVGAIGTNTTGFPNPADALMSQGAVIISGNVCCMILNLHMRATSLGHTSARLSLSERLSPLTVF